MPANRTENHLAYCSKALGKDEVASSNLAISSRSSEHVVSMGSGFFCCQKLDGIWTTSFGGVDKTASKKCFKPLFFNVPGVLKSVDF